jgi:phytanoyl-CoA hydroxylase
MTEMKMMTKEQVSQFERDGFIVLENFFNQDQCTKMYQEAGKIIEQYIESTDLEWLPTFPFATKNETPSMEQFDYFLESASDIKLFLNKKEYASDTSIDIQAKANVIRKRANRLGHALHSKNPVFREITFDDHVQNVVRSLGYKKPIVCQSLYLMMQPPDGPSSVGHQASTFVIVEPSKLLSFWIAVTDCMPENGCLEVMPGSHKKGVLKNKFIRNPNKREYEAGKRFIFTEPESEAVLKNGFTTVPLKAGSVILMDGYTVHRATPCTSHEPRNVYAFHIYDSDKAQFSKENWMEYNKETFLPLYTNKSEQ